MLVQADPAIHLTYCLNVHPGDSWRENFRAIREHAVRVRERVAPRQRFGLGLRLSARAAETLRHGDELGRFRDYLAARDLYVFTVNGFPYGAFHGEVVKENVYAPDWRHAERRDYTIALADILAELLPEGLDGSISTVPVSYKPWIASEADLAAAVGMLADVAAHLHGLRERTGRDICLASSPSPPAPSRTPTKPSRSSPARCGSQAARPWRPVTGWEGTPLRSCGGTSGSASTRRTWPSSSRT